MQWSLLHACSSRDAFRVLGSSSLYLGPRVCPTPYPLHTLPSTTAYLSFLSAQGAWPSRSLRPHKMTSSLILRHPLRSSPLSTMYADSVANSDVSAMGIQSPPVEMYPSPSKNAAVSPGVCGRLQEGALGQASGGSNPCPERNNN